VVVVEQALLLKEPTVHVVIPEHLLRTKLVKVVVVVREVSKEFQENHGVTAKDTGIIAAENMVAVAAVVVHHTVEALVAKVPYVLFGHRLEETIQVVPVKINLERNGDFLNVIYICR
jgi:hypothetical protein